MGVHKCACVHVRVCVQSLPLILLSSEPPGLYCAVRRIEQQGVVGNFLPAFPLGPQYWREPPPIRWSFPMDSWLHVETCYSQISQMWKVDLNLLCLPYSTYYTQGKKIIHIRGRHSYLQEGHSPIMYWDCRTIFSEMFT